MTKTVWIVDKHACPPDYETHFRYFKYAQYLKDKGYKVEIFISSFLHRQKIDLLKGNNIYEKREYNGIDYVLVKTLSYKNNGLRRMYSLFQFVCRIKRISRYFAKPDIIIHSSNAPFSNGLCKFAKRNNIKYVAEILDLWPESFVTFGLAKRKNPLIQLAFKMEKWLYKNADNVVFSMEGGQDYIIDKKWDKQFNNGPVDLGKVLYINNSVDLDDYVRTRTENPISFDYLDDKFFNIIYIGSISLANDVNKLIYAAELLQENINIRFYIYGNGSERSNIEAYCKLNNISNVFFKDEWIDYKYVPSLLSKSSLNVLNFLQSDSEKYGGCQGKLFNYIASGKPICSNIKMGYCLINKHNLGIAKEFNSPEEYADAFLKMSNLSTDDYNAICDNVEKVSLEYDFKIQSQKLLSLL